MRVRLPTVVVFVVIACVLVVCVQAGGYGKKKKEKINPPPNAAPELYPNLYPGLTARGTPARPLSQLPRAFNWCNHPDGHNYCTSSWNQHIPEYCGSCWVHGTLSMMNDRLKYELRSRPGTPEVMLSRQDVIDCSSKFGYGEGCNGGEAVDVLEYGRQQGIPDEGCNIYRAESRRKCDMEKRCMNCMMLQNDTLGHCWPVPNYVKYHVTEYGFVRGEEAMMTEIMARGPITCGIAVDEDFCFNYTAGVWKDINKSEDIDHDVEVVGWGEDERGVKYWQIRNSWGTYWGENGFFRIERGVNMMHLEEKCAFAIMNATELDVHLSGNMRGSMFGLIPPGKAPQQLPNNWDKAPHAFDTPENVAAEVAKQVREAKWIEKRVPTPRLNLSGNAAPQDALPSAVPTVPGLPLGVTDENYGRGGSTGSGIPWLWIVVSFGVGAGVAYFFAKKRESGYEPIN